MIINSLDFGWKSSPYLEPVSGVAMGDLTIEGSEHQVYPLAANPVSFQVSFFAYAWYSIGGAAAATPAATEYLLTQLEELARNPDLQPVYIRWDTTADPARPVTNYDPHDGWYIISDVQADRANFMPSSYVHVAMTATLVAPAAPNSTTLAYTGAALPTNASGTAKNLLALPPNGTLMDFGAAAFSRNAGIDAPGINAMSLVQSPNVNPSPLVYPTSGNGAFKGGVRVFDTINTVLNPVPSSATTDLFHSIGTEALGTLAAWTGPNGFSIAGNILSGPTTDGAAIFGGHPDWWDCTFRVRFQWLTGTSPSILMHTDQSFVNGILAGVDGANFYIATRLNSGGFTTIATAAVALTNTTQYWIQLQGCGTTYIATLYNDSGGSLGSVLAVISGVINTPVLQSGYVGIRNGGTVANKFGGAFANVCVVTGPAPNGWTSNPNGTWAQAGEPAFCWSRQQAFNSLGSLSVRRVTGGSSSPYWSGPAITAPNGTQYQVSSYIEVLNGGGGMSGFPIIVGGAGGAGISAGAWTQSAFNWTADGASHQMGLMIAASGFGTAYFDLAQIENSAWIGTGKFAAFADGFEAPFNGNWVEVFDTRHDFQGDCVITNGLLLLVLQTGQSRAANCYLWNTANPSAMWQVFATLTYQDNSGNIGTLGGYSLARVGSEECAVRTTNYTGTAVGEILIRLQRGRYEARVDFTPRSQNNSQNNAVALNFYASVKVVYTSTIVSDPSFATFLGAPTDYAYVAAFANAYTSPFICGLLSQYEPASGYTHGTGLVGVGDPPNPAQNATRSYGIFAMPFGTYGQYSTQNLQAEGENGDLGTGWSSVVDAAASNGHAAKCASGTLSANNDNMSNGFTTDAAAQGAYDLWARVKVTSNAGGSAEMRFGWYDSTASANIVSQVFAANQVGTTYGWIRIGAGFTAPAAGHSTFMYAQTTATLGTDWFVDEMFLVPKTLTTDNRGPQDLWQQFMFDRDVVLEVA